LRLHVPDEGSQKAFTGQELLMRQKGWQLPSTGGLTDRSAPTQEGLETPGEAGWMGQSEVV
jgi:hypothetical protein